MPVIKSAKKKLRQDRKRTIRNTILENKMKDLIKKARRTTNEKTVKEAVKVADRAAKQHIIHKNKAARIKSSLAKFLASS